MNKINIRYLSILCFLLPITTVIISYIISAKLDLVSSCIPNIDGCTSISRTGRYAPVKYFFKPLMFIYGVLLFFYWHQFYKILKSKNLQNINLTFYISILSVIFLFLYIIFLGEGSYYKFFRKIGIYVYILFAVLSQFFFSRKINLLSKTKPSAYNLFYIKINLFLTSILLILGILLIPLMIIKIDNFPQLKNIISWNYFMLMQFYFFISYKIWKKR